MLRRPQNQRERLQLAFLASLAAGGICLLVAGSTDRTSLFHPAALIGLIVCVLVNTAVQLKVTAHQWRRRQWFWVFFGSPAWYLWRGPWDAPEPRDPVAEQIDEPVGYGAAMRKLEVDLNADSRSDR